MLFGLLFLYHLSSIYQSKFVLMIDSYILHLLNYFLYYIINIDNCQ